MWVARPWPWPGPSAHGLLTGRAWQPGPRGHRERPSPLLITVVSLLS